MAYSEGRNGVPREKCRAAFGFFDGMHLGHRAVLARLPGRAAQMPVLLSFEEKSAPVLCTEREKQYLLREYGVERMVSVPFEAVSALSAEDFAREILCGRLNAGSVVAGENLRFGSDDKGIKELLALGERYGFTVDIVPLVREEGEAVTADAVKRAVRAGDFAKTLRLLGHDYVMLGRVVHGKGNGRRHGMPTANLAVDENKLFPPYGVYAALCELGGEFYGGLTNIGPRPSVDEDPTPTVETWLLDFSRDIYGEELVLSLHEYIRGIIKFPDGLEAVKRQIDRDLETAKSSLGQLLGGAK